jgi:hypothetical protein
LASAVVAAREDAAPFKIYRVGPDHNGYMSVPMEWLADCYAVEEVLDFEMRPDWQYVVFVHRHCMTFAEFERTHG